MIAANPVRCPPDVRRLPEPPPAPAAPAPALPPPVRIKDLPELMTTNDVARKLKVSRRTVWRWLKAGILPQPIRYSRTVIRWRASDILTWLQTQPRYGD